jgi:hypothetical protein
MFILLVSGIISIFFINLILLFGVGEYASLYEVLIFGFYGESLRTKKVGMLLGFTFATVVIALFQWTVPVRILLYHLNLIESVLFELPMAILFILSILMVFHVRSLNKKIKVNSVEN